MEGLVYLGFLTAVFVGINIGGSSTGVAFGPAIGASAITRFGAGILMSLSALLGGWTVGRNVVTTLGNDIIAAPEFSITAGLIVLVCIGFALSLANLAEVPASTSMVAVGAMVGMGIGTAGVQWNVLAEIVGWWFLAPVVAFGFAALVGRYAYAEFAQHTGLEDSIGSPISVSWNSHRPKVRWDERGSTSDLIPCSILLLVACYMGFSAGASNVSNAVAPLVGSGTVSIDIGVLLAISAISIGAFTIARRTMETVGNGLTSLPLAAACFVAIVGATITTVLSYLGIPASLALATIAAIIGLGWGRKRRAHCSPTPSPPKSIDESMRYDRPPQYHIHPAKVTLLSGSSVIRVIVVWTAAPVFALLVALLGTKVIL